MSEKMIIACPECATRFVAPLEKFLPAGRKVRCAKCGHAWFHALDAEQAAAMLARPDGETATLPQPTETAPRSAPPTAETPPTPRPAGDIIAGAHAARQTAEVAASPGATPADVESVRPALEPVHTQPGETPAASPAEPEAPPHTGAASDDAQKALSPSAATRDQTHVANLGATGAAVAGSTAMAGTGDLRAGDADPVPDAATVATSRGGSGIGRFLLYSLAAILVLGALAYFFREPLARQFPAAAPTLEAYGKRIDGIVGSVMPSTRPLRIDNVTYEFEEIEGGRALRLSAEVVNESDEAQPAPTLAMKIIGEGDTVLHEATMPTEDMSTEIEPTGRTPYFMRMPHPPEPVERVEVEFAPAS